MSRIIDIAKEISSGLTPLRSNLEYWTNGTIPWLKTEQIGEYRIKTTNEFVTQKALDKTGLKLYPQNTISIAMYGEGKTRGNVSILDCPMTTNQACCNIIPNEDIVEPFYLYYFFKTQYNNLRQLSSGVRKNLNSNDIKNYKINLPNKKIQKNIANFLCNIDEKIELNNKINFELENLAKTLYDYWFVQFDFPDEFGRPYKSSGGKMIYNEKLKQFIPLNWDSCTLNELCDMYQPQTLSEDNLIDDGEFFVYGANGIIGKYNQYNHSESEIAVACRGNSCGTINRTLPKSWITGNAMVVKLKNIEIHNEYLYHALGFTNIKGIITGSGQPQITRANLLPVKILNPDKNIILKYCSIIEKNVNYRLKNLIENQQLIKLRDFLLPMLMNGQVIIQQ